MNTAVSPLSPHAAVPGARPWLARTLASAWHALEESGQARAQRHLLDFAEQCQGSQPELAKELRAAARQSPLG